MTAALQEGLQATLSRIHAAASSKLAKEPVALDVREISSITDVLYVCHADSSRGVQAIVGEIVDGLREAGIKVPHVEGLAALQWVLVDLGDVMVHVFVKERREFYALERLWHDAPRLELPA